MLSLDITYIGIMTEGEEHKGAGENLSKSHFEYVLAEPENKIRKTKIICTLGYGIVK